MRVGPPGSGQTVKAANQLIVAGNLELVAEALVFLRASGVDPEVAVPVLAGGLAGSAVLDRKGPAMLAGAFDPGSGWTCTTRISASWSMRRGPPGWRFPSVRWWLSWWVRCGLRVTAGWIIPHCCAGCSGCRA